LLVGTAILVVLGLLSFLVATQIGIDGQRVDNASTTNRLSRQLRAQQALDVALASRVTAIEAILHHQPDPAVVAKTVGAAVFTVLSGKDLGSSFVVTSSGSTSSLVTNYHVVATTYESGGRSVSLRQGSIQLTGTIVKADKAADLVLIQVPMTLPVLARDKVVPSVGTGVLAVGSPFGLGGTVSSGIVSAMRNGLIQFSAPISPGDSGGPLVDASGQVIGITESKLVGAGAEGLSFAIPVAVLCRTVASC